MEYIFLLTLMLLMAGAMSFLILYARNATNILQRLLTYVFASMMAGMLIGPLIYLVLPGSISIAGGAEISLVSMTVLVIPYLIVFMDDVLTKRQERPRFFIHAYVAFFVIFDEILMSLIFNLVVNPQVYLHLLHSNLLSFVWTSIASYWFVFPMGLEMFLTLLFMHAEFSSHVKVVLLIQAALMTMMPTAIMVHPWEMGTIYISGALMTGFFIYMFEYLYRKHAMKIHLGAYVLLLLFSYSAMMAGIFLWIVVGDYAVIALAMVVDMLVYLSAALNSGWLSKGKSLYWISSKNWSFLFLLIVFVAEFFMGAVFDAVYYGAHEFMQSTGIIMFSGTFFSDIGIAVFDFFTFVAHVSLSSWFLIMMGIEMGSLVAFKIRSTRELETRIRLALMLAAYGVYSIFIPSFLISNPSSIPFVGWTMGIGSGGAFSLIFIVPIALTYLISGILSLLFGSRQLCSTFCTAPVMYQGTFYDSLKKFNGSSPSAKVLTSQTRKGEIVYRTVSLSVYTALILSASVSLLDSLGYLNFYFYGTDPSYMVYLFLFGFLWYAVFITMPFLGSYGCINTGYCHWGNFNRFLSRFGFFRLKVRDPMQCVSCTTKDCASACPVGNYGQPGKFIQTGEYKESRCVGIGDCVDACPYENIFYYDIRHWIKEKLPRKH
jgi:polyferredoxin